MLAAPRAMETRSLQMSPRGAVVVSEHRCSAGPEHRPFEEQHVSTNIALVVAGAFRYRSQPGAVSLGPGSIMLGNAGQPYVCSHELGTGDHCICFSLRAGVTDAIASELSVAPRFARLSAPPAPLFAGVWARALAAAHGSSHAPSTEEIAYELAAALLTAQADRRPSAPAITTRDERRAADAMRWLDERAADPVGLDDAADAAGVGPFHFLRTFRKVVGVTPHQYLVGARLRRAAQLLLETDRPVTDVAYDAGFGDLSNFIRTFRRATGAAPREFRKVRGQVKIRQVRAAALR